MKQFLYIKINIKYIITSEAIVKDALITAALLLLNSIKNTPPLPPSSRNNFNKKNKDIKI